MPRFKVGDEIRHIKNDIHIGKILFVENLLYDVKWSRDPNPMVHTVLYIDSTYDLNIESIAINQFKQQLRSLLYEHPEDSKNSKGS